MYDRYEDGLKRFAYFYFANMFKGLTYVETIYAPQALATRVTVKIVYNDICIEDASQYITDSTCTLDVLDILDELMGRLKRQYDIKLSEKENIFR